MRTLVGGCSTSEPHRRRALSGACAGGSGEGPPLAVTENLHAARLQTAALPGLPCSTHPTPCKGGAVIIQAFLLLKALRRKGMSPTHEQTASQVRRPDLKLGPRSTRLPHFSLRCAPRKAETPYQPPSAACRSGSA